MNHSYTTAQKAEQAYQDHFNTLLFVFVAAGLTSEIRSRALAGVNPPRTAANLLTAARTIESELKKGRKLVETISAQERGEVTAVGANAAEKPEEEDEFSKRVDAVFQKKYGKILSAGAQPRRCFTCGQLGHLSYDCQKGRGASQVRGAGYRGAPAQSYAPRGGFAPRSNWGGRGGPTSRASFRGAPRGGRGRGTRPVWTAEQSEIYEQGYNEALYAMEQQQLQEESQGEQQEEEYEEQGNGYGAA
jgi:hypothetical protein